MTHLLDTDHLSILQHIRAAERAAVVANINLQPAGAVAVSVVSFHEQFRGAHKVINAARTAAESVRGYKMLFDRLNDYTALSVVPFDAAAAAVFDLLRQQKVRTPTMDLRIAATALSRNLTLVTRNARDFNQVPGLRIEDWTK